MAYVVAAVDDERPALEVIAELLRQMEAVGDIHTFSSPVEALKAMPALCPDIVFLDIQMPEVNGLQFAEQLHELLPKTEVVFVTAYHQYAVKAFDLSATDYLLKPIKPERLRQTIERIQQRRGVQREAYAPPSPAAPSVMIQGLGRFQFMGSQGKVRWSIGKVEELFAYLCFNRHVSVNQMMDDLFETFEYDKARQYMHTCIYQIRKSLKQAAMDSHISLVYDQRYYQLEIRDVECDWIRFEALLGERAGRSLETLLEAEALYRGELLEGFGATWMLSRREILRKQYSSLLQDIVERCVQAKRYEMAIRYATKLLDQDPYDEGYGLLLVEIHMAQGDRREAKVWFEQFLDRYQAEMGEPLSKVHMRQFQRVLGE